MKPPFGQYVLFFPTTLSKSKFDCWCCCSLQTNRAPKRPGVEEEQQRNLRFGLQTRRHAWESAESEGTPGTVKAPHSTIAMASVEICSSHFPPPGDLSIFAERRAVFNIQVYTYSGIEGVFTMT